MSKHICKTLIFLNAFLLIITVPFSSYAEMKHPEKGRELYLLAATPTKLNLRPRERVDPNEDGFPALLYKTGSNKGELALVREIVPAEWGTEFIRYYRDERLIIIGQQHIPQFVMIEMDAPRKEKSFKMTYRYLSPMRSVHLLDIPGRGLFLGLNIFVSDKRESRLYGMNLSAMKQEDLSWDVYKYLLMSGVFGLSLFGGSDCVYVIPDSNGRFKIFMWDKDIQTDWSIPDPDLFLPGKGVSGWACANNHDMLVVSHSKKIVRRKKGLGSKTYFIFNKKEKSWHSIRFEGSKSCIRAFGPWIAGGVTDIAQETDSPGRSNRRKKRTVTGIPLDERLKMWKTYSAGILFLYNVNTRKKYTIRTNQGDNEVLLVEGGTVYYRVNRSIYRAAIGKNRIEQGTIIAEHDVVPDIHWAFTGPVSEPVKK